MCHSLSALALFRVNRHAVSFQVKTSVMQTRAATVGPAMMLEMLFDVPALLNGVAVHVILVSFLPFASI